MANPTPLDLRVSPATFVDDRGPLFTLKVDRLERWSAADAPARAVADWANLVDDFMIAAQQTLRLLATGTGSPQGAVAAEVGTIYLNTEASPSGTRMWVKATGSGTSGWSQVGGTIEPGTLDPDVLTDGDARSVLGVPGNAQAARADIASGGARRFLGSNAANTGIAFRVLEAADIPTIPTTSVDGVAYESDWSALPSTVDVSSNPINFVDGPVVLGDRTWQSAVVSAAATWRIANGIGLQWAPLSGGAGTYGFTIAAQTAPYLWILMSDLVGSTYEPLGRYVIEVQVSGFVAANSGRLYVGFWNTSTSRLRFAGRRTDGSPSPNTTSLRDAGAVSGAVAPVGDLLGIAADNSGAMHVLDGSWPTGNVVYSTFGAPGTGDAPMTHDTRVVISSSVARGAGLTAAWNIEQIRVRRVG